MKNDLDLTNPLHARAYLNAASHFLSGWPQAWTAEQLCLALVTEDAPAQKEIKIWDGVKYSIGSDDPFLCSDELICSLAENFIDFLEENRNIAAS